jgi:tRNA-splicing ligase RtcB
MGSDMKQHKIYSDSIDGKALSQFYDAMRLDCVVKGALMPDAHAGYTLPIGAVVATKGVIFPSWVGYDIGCGMCAMPTTFPLESVAGNKESIFTEIYKRIPVGFDVHRYPVDNGLDPDNLTSVGRKAFDDRKGFRSLGTLGGGNHFIEIGSDEIDKVWIIIHSGSRGVGQGIGSQYMTIAASDPSELEDQFDASHKKVLKHNPAGYDRLKESWVKNKLGKLKPKEGHYGFYVDSQEGQDYINDMDWALEFALANRKQIMHSVIASMNQSCDGSGEWGQLINRNHNHAELKDGLWVHRKGATHAENGMMGVIPGNMRDGSFIVRGKGESDSLCSSSHGAGRVLGRKEAKRKLEFSDFEKSMAGITARVCSDTLDEAPMAYKNIFEVMNQQSDLVDIVAHVKPVINIKG